MRERLHVAFPSSIAMLIDTLDQAGFEAYAVGGCVRDSLLGRIPADWDICTSALPEQICDCFAQYRLIYTGIKHGTVTVVAENQPVEITTYRIDGTYSDHRHPDHVIFSESLPADLSRRDFTVNAMAYHPQKGLIDLYSGAEDLQAGVIRCVGEPNARFQEDALRILRALRFAAVYGFSIAPQTACAIHAYAPLLRQIATERITGELCKLLCGNAVQQVLNAFPDVFAVALPFLPSQTQRPDFLEQWQRASAVIAYVDGSLEITLAELAHLSIKQYGFTEEKAAYEAALSWTKKLRLDRGTGKRVAMLAANRSEPILTEERMLKRLLYRLGTQQTLLLITAHRAHMLARGQNDTAERMQQAQEQIKRMIDENVCFNRAGLAVNGADLKRMGITDGKTIGKLLDQMVVWVIDDQVENQKKQLLEKIL